MYALRDNGSTLEADIRRVVAPAKQRTDIVAKMPELIAALSSGNTGAQTYFLNTVITKSTEIDAIALFDAAGKISAINTCYTNGQPISGDRVSRIMGTNFSQRKIIQSCLRNASKSSILEFQTHCDITPAFFDSTGLSVAYSVPVVDPTTGQNLGVVSARLRFERLSSLIEHRTLGGGAVRAYFITDAGGYFSESINSGRETPPVPVSELRGIIQSDSTGTGPQAVTRRLDKYLAVFFAQRGADA